MTALNPFLILIAVSGLGSLLTNTIHKRIVIFFCILLAALILPHVQLSDNVFYDEFFTTVRIIDLSDTRVEPGYFYLNKFFAELINYEIFRAGVIVTVLCVKVYMLSRFSKNSIIILSFYFAVQFYVDSYLLRASLAGSFVLLALYSKHIDRPVSGTLLLAVAISFHISALAVVPLFLLLNLRLSKRKHLAILALLFTLSFFPLAEIVLGTLGQFVPSLAATSYALSYIGSTHGEEAGILRGSVLLYSLVYLVFLSTVETKEVAYSRNANFILNCMLYALIFLLAFNDMVVISDRLSRYTLFFFAIAVGIITDNLRSRSAGLASFIIICISVGVGFAIDEGPYRPV